MAVDKHQYINQYSVKPLYVTPLTPTPFSAVQAKQGE